MADNFDYFGDVLAQIDESWHPTFSSVRVKADLADIGKRLSEREAAGETIYPAKGDIFRLFRLVPLNCVKCVIVAQDPYHNGEATGVAFSGRRAGVIPMSLQNIWTEVIRCFPKQNIKPLKTPYLEGWCEQGVFLLNQSLTVTAGEPDSHKGIWSGVVTSVLYAIAEECAYAPWVLWGQKAKKLKDKLEKKGIKHILEAAHPSGYSVAGFRENGHFSQINDILREYEMDEIDWSKHDPS